MKTSIIYASHTGTTHRIAEQLHEACGGELFEVNARDLLSRVIGFMARHSPGMQVRESGTMPETIDVSGSGLIVIGTPVWGGKPVPSIRKAVERLQGCKGKTAILFATCGENPGKTLQVLAADLEAKGMTIAGQISLNKKEIEEGPAVSDLIAKVSAAGECTGHGTGTRV